MNFVKDELEMPNCDDIVIEKASRVKSKNSSVCSIVVQFLCRKDRDTVLNVSN